MAEEIVLSGQFRDNITPQLKKLSRELNNVTKSFEKIQKKLRPIAREMGNLAAASERVAGALKAQKSIIDQNARSWGNYRNEVGKAGAAQRRAFKGAPRGGTPAPRLPRTTRTTQAAIPPGGGIGGADLGLGIGLSMVGNQLTNLVVNGILTGFRIGTNLLSKPFTFLANGIGERIQDEMSDIKAAGGLFAISQRMDNPLVASFREAEQLTKETNRYLAELAGALPGDTQQYIQVAKQISDTVAQVAATNEAGFIEFGRELAAGRGADFTGDTQGAFKEITGELTKLTVLASGGQMTAGAFGLPMLTEQMISRAEVSLSQFQRYASVFRDPQIMSALTRNIEEINATGQNTVERAKAVRKMFQEVVTPEFIRRVSRSTEGVIETVKTAILNPEVGLLGLGRPLERLFKATDGMGQLFDSYGRELFTTTKELKKGNKVIKKGTQLSAEEIRELGFTVSEVAKPAREAQSIFDYLRNIFADVVGTAAPLLDILAGLLPIFDGLAKQLDGIRNATAKLTNAQSFLQETFMKVAEDQNRFATKELQAAYKASISVRSSLGAFVYGLEKLGAFGEGDAERILQNLMNPDFTDFGSVLTQVIDQILNGPAAKEIGNQLGQVIGTIVRTFADLLTGIFGDTSLESDLVKGFVEGFNMKGIDGSKAIKEIFQLVFDKLFELVLTAIRTFPKESAIIAGIAIAPAIATAIATAIGTSMLKLIPKLFSGAAKTGGDITRRGLARSPGRARIATSQMAGNVSKRASAIPGVAQAGRASTRLTGGLGPGVAKAASGMLKGGKAKAIGPLAAGIITLSTKAPQLAKAGKALTAVGKRIPILNVAFAGLDFGLKKLEGKDTAQAASEAGGGLAGSVIGGAIGTAIAPGIGTAIGAILGGLVGDWLGSKLPGMLASAGTFFTQTIPAWWNGMISALPGILQSAWDGLVKFLTEDVPFALGSGIRAVGLFITQTIPQLWNSYWEWWKGNVKAAIEAVGNFIKSLPGLLSAAWSGFTNWLAGLPGAMQTMVDNFVAWAQTLPGQILDGLKNMGGGIVGGFKSWAQNFLSGLTGGDPVENTDNAHKGNFDTPLGRQLKKVGFAHDGSLGSAIATEMKHKPPGSNLVIANSSETIIPAYKGLVPDISPVISAFTGYTPENSSLEAQPAFTGYTPEGSQTLEMIPTRGPDKSRGDVTFGNINVTINGAEKTTSEMANEVATEILSAVRQATYSELDLT